MTVKFVICAAAALSLGCTGLAEATTITNSYTMGTIGAGVSDSSSGALINSWSYTDPVTGEGLAANVSVVTGSGASSQYASATGDTYLAAIVTTNGSWTDTYLVSGPTNGSAGSLSVFAAVNSTANGTPATDNEQVNWSVATNDLTNGQNYQRTGSWNVCTPTFNCGSSNNGTTSTVPISIANRDIIQISGSLWQNVQAQQGATGGNTYSLSSSFDITSIELSSGYTLTPVPLPTAAWLMISGLGGLGAMVRKRKTAYPAPSPKPCLTE